MVPEEAEAGVELEDVVEAEMLAVVEAEAEMRDNFFTVMGLPRCAPSSSRIAAPAATRADFATSCRQEERLMLLHNRRINSRRRAIPM